MPNSAAANSELIEIFRAGRHTDMHGRQVEVTREDIADMASAYDPEKSEAPLVVGHPRTNAPAYGWARGLVAQGDLLLAQPHQVDADFAEMVKAGRFKKRSASFFLPDAKDNPVPGKWYLRHIGFLGAAAPAVKGLKDAQFAGDNEGVVEFAAPFRWWTFAAIADLFRGIRERLIETDGIEKANAVIPAYQIDSIREAAREPDATTAYADAGVGAEEIHTEDNNMPDKNADFAARETELASQKTQLDARDRALKEREAKAQRDDAVEFADGLVLGGKLLPKDKATVVELLLALPAEKPLSFASGDDTIEKPAADLLRELLDGMPQRVDFSEKSATGDDEAGAASFAAPQGALVDAGQLELHRKATAYQAQHPNVSFTDAYKAVGGR
jgi:hypothetical protein